MAVAAVEIERRALHGPQLAGGNQHRIDRREAAGVDGDFVAEDVALTGALQVEVGVVGEVDHGRLIRGRGVIDLQFVLVRQRVNHLGGKRCRGSLPRRLC